MKLKELCRENIYVQNLFAFLGVLAVSGHFIDICQVDSWVSKGLYLFTVSIYMPLLVFISGALFKNIAENKGLILRLACSSLGLYALMTLIINIVKYRFGEQISFSLLSESEPSWIFYSFAIYLLLGYCVKRLNKKVLLTLTFILALFCDYSGVMGNFLAMSPLLSRTIIFCPFFLIGWICGTDLVERIAKRKVFRTLGICILALVLFVMVIYIRQCEFLIPLVTGKNAYTQLGWKALYGPLYRFLIYIINVALVISVLSITPGRSFGKYINNLGERFVQIYFWHYPILCILIGYGIYDFLIQILGRKCGRVLWLICALICTTVLSKKLLFCWKESIRNYALRSCIFILVGIVGLNKANNIIVNRQNFEFLSANQIYGNFYEEKRNSLDAVYIGSSAVFTSWFAPLAWNNYGITISPLSASGQPFLVCEYVIKEARKTQPNALYIIPISSYDVITSTALHYVAANIPLSWNKVQMVKTMGEYMDINWGERLEYLLPIIRFHDRWTQLRKVDFHYLLDGVNKSFGSSTFFRNSTNVSSSYRTTNRTTILSETMQSALNSLLEYCDTEQLNVLFVLSPGLKTNEQDIAVINSIKEIVEFHGYPVLSLQPSVEEINLDMTKDYYDDAHTNIHGAIKTTDYLSRYLIENYSFEDKRGDPAYSSWDEAYASYTEQYASAYTLDVEWEGEPRDFTLAAPTVKTAVNGKTITVSWNAISGADGYRIYTKDALGNSWQTVDIVDADTLSYDDPLHEAGTTYYYTVIAFRKEDGIRYWGDYNFAGVTAKALLDPPELLAVEGSENDLSLFWRKVQGADGYTVLRRLPSKSWIEIADVGDTLTFTDTNMLSNMPYQYTVRAYYLDKAGSRNLGSYDTNGLLYTPELKPLKMKSTAEEDGSIHLTWERIEGIQGYSVYRKIRDKDWEQLTTENLSADSTEFRDITAQAGEWYTYKAEAYIRIGEQERIYTLQPEPEWITTKEAMYDISSPEIIYLEQAWNQVYIAWEATEGAASYNVYRRALAEDDNWDEWTAVNSSVKATTYLDKPPAEGEYQYLIQPLFVQDGLTYYGGFEEEAGNSIVYSNIAA